MDASREFQTITTDWRLQEVPTLPETGPPLVLVVDDESEARGYIGTALKRAGMEAVEAADGATALTLLDRHRGAIDVLVIEAQLPDQLGLTLVTAVQERDPRMPIVMITDHGSIPAAVEAIRHGVTDYLTKPLQVAEFVDVVSRAAKRRQRWKGEDWPARGSRPDPGPHLPPAAPAGNPLPMFRFQCPQCNAVEACPSRLLGLDYLLVAMLFRPYRCNVCKRRFWRWRLSFLLPS